MKTLITAVLLAVSGVNLGAAEGWADPLIGLMSGTVPATPAPARVAFPAAPTLAEDPCYLKEEGCRQVSGFYIVRNRKWDLKYAGDCDVIVPNQGLPNVYASVKNKMCKAIKAKYPGTHSQSEIGQMCQDVHNKFQPSIAEQLWGPINLNGAIHESESNCRAIGENSSWFTDLVEIEYLQSGELSSGGEKVLMVAKKLTGDNTYKIYEGSAQNIYNIALQVTCRNYGNIWKNETLSIRVDMPSQQSVSSNVSFSVGASFGSVGGGTSVGTSYSTPYGKWQELGIKGLFCGSAHDTVDDPNSYFERKSVKGGNPAAR